MTRRTHNNNNNTTVLLLSVTAMQQPIQRTIRGMYHFGVPFWTSGGRYRLSQNHDDWQSVPTQTQHCGTIRATRTVASYSCAVVEWWCMVTVYIFPSFTTTKVTSLGVWRDATTTTTTTIITTTTTPAACSSAPSSSPMMGSVDGLSRIWYCWCWCWCCWC